ncbi:hypothetical protein LGH70_22600 [Hymenobacter sp. BT635]|uniref:Uncharacterized protein n=1 Tax=Hymenobacter nitidus TaxID=2880929 RepID=A0ABS8AIY8_9BACT|nr:hypothetical protein [Hymenobacter nitidus]MCB2380400.1 hypothetical protein [Hymenobacter nitidus]
MKHHFAVLNSNEVTRDGTSFQLAELEKALWQTAVVGVPSNVGHDAHRPIGWMLAYGLYLQPNLVRTVGELHLPESLADSEKIVDAHDRAFHNRQHRMSEPYVAPLTELLREYASEECRYLYCEAFSCIETDLVKRVFPKLTENLDDDGLVYLTDLLKEFTYLGQGVFAHKRRKLTVFAHPYFRRSLSRFNNFHFLFLDELMSYVGNRHIRLRLRLDWDMVGYAPSFQKQLEYEFWRGPKFDDEISNITPGLTQYKSDAFERVYYGTAATEFVWKAGEETDGKPLTKPRLLHEFEMEEVKDSEVPGTESYGCRYMHAIYDKDAATFEHFDGAIRMYDLEQMVERADTPMDEFGRKSQYTKLFRIDDPLRLDEKRTGQGLALSNWKSLVTRYMQGNPQVYEYFGEEKPGGAHLLEEEPHSIREELVPSSMKAGQGVRLFASYHALREQTTGERVVTGRDVATGTDDIVRPALEYDVIEVRKALRALGTDLEIPSDVVFIYAEDGYWNIPTIYHGEQDPQAALSLTVQALNNLMQAAHNRGHDQVVSFTVAWAMNDKEARVSVLGHVADLAAWFKKAPGIPTQRKAFVKWLQQQEKYLNSLPVIEPEWPKLDCIAKSDGVLFISRHFVDRKWISAGSSTGLQLAIPEDQTDLIESLKKHELAVTTVWQAGEMTCSKTGMDYWLSPHSKNLEPGVSAIVKGSKLMALCWTDKPA